MMFSKVNTLKTRESAASSQEAYLLTFSEAEISGRPSWLAANIQFLSQKSQTKVSYPLFFSGQTASNYFSKNTTFYRGLQDSMLIVIIGEGQIH